MQQLFDFRPVFYYAIGQSEKTSLILQFCRENNYLYLKDPLIDHINPNSSQNVIIEASKQLFPQLEKSLPELHTIQFGNELGEKDKQIIMEYSKIGKCKKVKNMIYEQFRKAMYPNIIFIYGANDWQVNAVATTLANNIGYACVRLPPNANTFIDSFKKTANYVVEGSFTDKSEINILQSYFNIRIIHLQYNRIDIPSQSTFFDKQFNILPFLKLKSYYIRIDGSASPIQIMDDVGIGLCPQLIYVNRHNKQQQHYIRKYVKQTDGLLLSVQEIQSNNKRKNGKLANDIQGKCLLLNQIIFKDLNIKQVLIADFPWTVEEFITFENLNRKFKWFIDLQENTQYKYSASQYTCQMYFLQQHKRVTPSLNQTLKDYLNHTLDYWIVNGASFSGRTTVSQYIAGQFGYKLIEIENYIAANKDKIVGPQDGDQVPFKKVVAHFKTLLSAEPSTIYLFDGFPYQEKQLTIWLQHIGAPKVLNLQVAEAELVKRMRRKNQADINAQVNEQESNKIKQAINKNKNWVNKLGELSGSACVYKLDYNMAKILSEEYINAVLKPRIYLIQKHQGLTFQNVALKYNMAFINLYNNSLKDCRSIVRNSNKKDIILCYYQQKQQLVSEDLYWIQKHLGTIRYLAVWNSQPKQVQQQVFKLEKPHVQKPLKPQGQEGDPKNQQQKEDAQGIKKGIDIYEFQWTKPSFHKNLSQWFLKLKKQVHERKNTPKQCYEKFQEVIEIINSKKSSVVYESIN